jgi:hypothetical protein
LLCEHLSRGGFSELFFEMANGLYCAEAAVLPVTPKYRHDSNSENTPPPSRPLEPTTPDSVYHNSEKQQQQHHNDLLCREVLEEGRELHKEVLKAWGTYSLPQQYHQHSSSYQQQQYQSEQFTSNFNHPPVKADYDSILLKDDRVLQNLLRNEER